MSILDHGDDWPCDSDQVAKIRQQLYTVMQERNNLQRENERLREALEEARPFVKPEFMQRIEKALEAHPEGVRIQFCSSGDANKHPIPTVCVGCGTQMKGPTESCKCVTGLAPDEAEAARNWRGPTEKN